MPPADSPTTPPPLRVSAGSVPTWDLGDLISRDCPGCDCKTATSVCRRPDKLDVVRCTACGLAFVRQVPSDKQLLAFYQRYAFYKGYSDHRDVPARRLSWRELVFHCSQNLYIEALEETGGIAGRSVLDMGCSTGDFLQLIRFKKGMPRGVEIDGSARAAAQSLGFQVDETPPAEGSFDVITAFHVLEHLPDPRSYVAKMAKLVRPEGRVIVAVPNATETRDFASAWIGFRVDLEHLNFFDVGSLSQMLQREGLFVEHCWQHHQPSLIRTDLPSVPRSNSLRDRAERWMERFDRIISPPAKRFLDGSFSLSIVARRL